MPGKALSLLNPLSVSVALHRCAPNNGPLCMLILMATLSGSEACVTASSFTRLPRNLTR